MEKITFFPACGYEEGTEAWITDYKTQTHLWDKKLSGITLQTQNIFSLAIKPYLPAISQIWLIRPHKSLPNLQTPFIMKSLKRYVQFLAATLTSLTFYQLPLNTVIACSRTKGRIFAELVRLSNTHWLMIQRLGLNVYFWSTNQRHMVCLPWQKEKDEHKADILLITLQCFKMLHPSFLHGKSPAPLCPLEISHCKCL